MYAGAQTKPLTESDVILIVAQQVHTFETKLSVELMEMITAHESSSQPVTMDMIMQRVEKTQQLRSGLTRTAEASKEPSNASSDRNKGKGNFNANQAFSQRTCFICGSEHHTKKDCPRGNHQAINDGKAAAPTVGKKDTSKKGGSINTQDEDKKGNSNASSGRREPCQICTQMGMRDWVARTHSTKECRNAAKIAMKSLKGETIHGQDGKKSSSDQRVGQQTDKGSAQDGKSQSEATMQSNSSS